MRLLRWKTGFYFIALQAEVPVSFDDRLRRLTILPAFWQSGRLDEDLATLQTQFRTVVPRYPEGFAGVESPGSNAT